MKYIEYKQFRQSSDKVQKEIFKRWKPQIGDLYNEHDEWEEDFGEGTLDNPLYRHCETNKLCMVDEEDLNKMKDIFIASIGFEIQPLLTEGQIIDMIEEITGCKIEVEINNYNDKYNIFLEKFNGIDYRLYKDFYNISNDRLLAYWNVLNILIEEGEM